MLNKDKIAIIIPAYNEEGNIENLIKELDVLIKNIDNPVGIILVNDCSIDSTSELAKKLECTVLDLPINLGIGGAVQTGMKYALLFGYDFAIQVDGDGQHPPKEIPKLIEAMDKTNSDIVIGSRFIEKAGYRSTFLRRLGIRYFQQIIKWMTGLNITDCTSGFRIFNKKALVLASQYYPDEYPEPESIILFALNGLKITEAPVIMDPRLGGTSSIQYLNSLYYTAKVTLAILFTFVKLKVWKISRP